jgi:hypothetical protein
LEVPLIVADCTSFLLLNGLHVQGIFRTSGSKVVLDELVDKYNCGIPNLLIFSLPLSLSLSLSLLFAVFLATLCVWTHIGWAGEPPKLSDLMGFEEGSSIVSGLLKRYLRELPEPLLTWQMFHEFSEYQKKGLQIPPSSLFLSLRHTHIHPPS